MKTDLRWDKIQAKEVYYSFLDHAIAHLVRLNLLDAIGEMSTSTIIFLLKSQQAVTQHPPGHQRMY